jgi:DNA-binding transcriptional regulator GbsR (MarR family)
MNTAPELNTPLADAKNMLVRRWGEMGGYWGISRTMAEIHALLFVTKQPLCTDDIMARLHVSRGNASMNLRALVDWGLIQRAHKLGDRKEYFVADTDVWHMFETITRERRRREVEPIVATIDRCIASAEATADGAAIEAEEKREFVRRLKELRDFLTTMGALFELVLQYGNGGMARFAKVLDQPGLLSGGGANGNLAESPPATRKAASRTTAKPARKGRG